MNAERAKRAVEAALEGVGRLETVEVKVQPSGIMGSPHDHVYVYLTDDEDGPHVILSDFAELDAEKTGFVVGAYFEPGEAIEEPSDYPTLTAAAGRAARFVGELSGLVGG